MSQAHWEVLGHANEVAKREVYRLLLATASGGNTTTRHGLLIAGVLPLRALRGRPHAVIVAGVHLIYRAIPNLLIFCVELARSQELFLSAQERSCSLRQGFWMEGELPRIGCLSPN